VLFFLFFSLIVGDSVDLKSLLIPCAALLGHVTLVWMRAQNTFAASNPCETLRALAIFGDCFMPQARLVEMETMVGVACLACISVHLGFPVAVVILMNSMTWVTGFFCECIDFGLLVTIVVLMELLF